MIPPVFLLASERSGTNLLRRRLTEYQETYFGPSPLHLLKHLYWAEPYYGSFDEDEAFDRFIGNSIGLAYHHFSPWDEDITVEQVRTEYENYFQGRRCSVGVMHIIYSLYAKRKGYSSYFCKDNNLFDFVSDIKLEIPEAKFIFLYRDPRDVVVSQLRRPLQNKSVSFLSDVWREEQVKCIPYYNYLHKDRDAIAVSYEELIENESKCIEKVCSFLGVKMLDQKSDLVFQEQTDIQEWVHLEKPTMTSNSGKFKTNLSSSKINKVESICWQQMRFLGYAAVNNDRPSLSFFRKNIEILLGKIVRFGMHKIIKKKLTKGQLDQIEYVKKIKLK